MASGRSTDSTMLQWGCCSHYEDPARKPLSISNDNVENSKSKKRCRQNILCALASFVSFLFSWTRARVIEDEEQQLRKRFQQIGP